MLASAKALRNFIFMRWVAIPLIIALIVNLVSVVLEIRGFEFLAGFSLGSGCISCRSHFLFQLAIPNLIFIKAGPRIELWEIVGADCGFLVAASYAVNYWLIRHLSAIRHVADKTDST